MRLRPLLWLLLGLMVVGILYRLYLFSGVSARSGPSLDLKTQVVNSGPDRGGTPLTRGHQSRFPYRLTNTSKPLEDLLASDRAILLENALIDMTQPVKLPIPDEFRSHAANGSYIVQSRGPLNRSEERRVGKECR